MRSRTASLNQSALGRGGLSLLEVVLAAVILAGSLAVLGQYLNAARLASGQAASETEALVLAESLMDDAVAALSSGAVPADVFEDSGTWRNERTAVPIDEGPLHHVNVVVTRSSEEGQQIAQVTLERFVLLAEVDE